VTTGPGISSPVDGTSPAIIPRDKALFFCETAL